jgi:RimJ/RimL family protein N-acetyltransferase
MRLKLPRKGLVDGDVTLRTWREDDAAAVFPLISGHRDITYWTRIPWPYTWAHAQEHVRNSRAAWQVGSDAALVIADTASDRMLGSIGLHHINAARDPASALYPNEIGYWLAPSARGRGVTTRSVRLVTDWAFDTLKLPRLWLTVIAGNEASEAVALRAGFVLDHTRRAGECLDDPRAHTVFTKVRPDLIGIDLEGARRS